MAGIQPGTSVLGLLQELEPRLPQLDRRALAEELAPLVARLHERLPEAEAATVPDVVLALCRRLYANARSGDALPLARALLAQASLASDPVLERRASSACGLLAADAADAVGAIAYQARALALAAAARDRVEQSRTWNNIGIAFSVAGNPELEARCCHRALALVRDESGPVYSRYAASSNLAKCLFNMGQVAEGLQHGSLALQESTPAFVAQDPHGAILLRRNLVRLLIAAERVPEAEIHVKEVAALALETRTPRARIAAATTRAAFEMATGQSDIALTRLEEALARARGVPAALHDTLSCVIRAEEASGNAERALVRLQELSDHVYRLAVDRAREHVELSGLCDLLSAGAETMQEQARARLVSRLRPPGAPSQWKALQRLGIAAALRMDNTGWHGVRVGALTKALAAASGCAPLQSLEIGLAAELHDIGLASVPEAIFSKAGELNEVERAFVQRHTEAGAEMLRDDRDPRILMAREIATYHHARWDGNGYPERVGGSFIPFAARMCAVADAYDEMVCGHWGRRAMTMDEALVELRREAGGQFEPALVRTFETVIRGESADRGIDTATVAGLESFQELVLSLEEDRGFI